jgi:uncharacterized membrane protein YhaH (DUF805 family)
MFAAVRSVYANMFNFGGRARRAEYWWYFLFVIVMNFAISGALTGWMVMQAPAWAMPGNEAAAEALMMEFRGQFIAGSVVALVLMLFGYLIPQLAVTVRRLHDTGRSGWWIFKPFLVGIAAMGGIVVFAMGPLGGAAAPGLMVLAVFVPFACNVWYIVVMCLPGDHGDNRFGPDPIRDRKPSEAGHPALVKEMDEELSRQVALQRREEFKDYYQARVLPAIERNKSARRA